MKLSSEQVAKKAGISYSTYNNIETGKASPKLETALKIAKVFRTKIEILFNLEENA